MAVFAHDPSRGRLANVACDTHDQGGIWGAVPLPPIDLFEHAYCRDFGPARARDVEAFLANVDWRAVDRNFAGAP